MEINPVRGKKRYSIDVVGKLQKDFPVFFELLGENRLNWKTIERVLSQKMDASTTLAQYNRIEDRSFYTLLHEASGGDSEAELHLFSINKLFEELIERLDSIERKLIVPTLFGLLANVDNKFWNFVGELLILNSFKAYGNLRLLAVEVPSSVTSPGGPRIDFQFHDSQNSTTLLVEVVNVHMRGCVHWTDEQINHILHQKMQHKLNKTNITGDSNFSLVPVFWGSYEDRQRIHSLVQSGDLKFENILEPSAAPLCLKTESLNHIYLFGRVAGFNT